MKEFIKRLFYKLTSTRFMIVLIAVALFVLFQQVFTAGNLTGVMIAYITLQTAPRIKLPGQGEKQVKAE